ncbi:MAG: CRISPR-associated helicase Cas3', partial [Methanosarcinales archaeon]
VTTVEAMRKRFENIFGKEEVSFSHHLLDISLMEEERLTEAELFVQKHLLKPTAVTTIDRILLSLMNYRRFTVSEIMLNNATLIIDEIHSYSPFTFSLIVEALRYLKEYHNVRLCIMSATMPQVIKDAFIKLDRKRTNKIRSLLSDKEVKEIYSEKKRTKIAKFYPGRLILEGIDEIIKAFKKHRKILVVVNTVSKAQTLFDMVKERTDKNTRIVLFHSRFTYGDRNKKQKEIDRINRLSQKVIFIATQIVEVSLDIDFDVLFTEIAPIDAIVQRAGRINRKGRKNLCNIYIFDVKDEEKGYLPYKRRQIEESRHIICTAKVKSEVDYLEMNEVFYNKIKDYYQFELQENKLDDFLEQIYEKGSIDKALSTRDGFLTIPVVPKCFKERVEETQKEIGRINQDLSMTKNTQERERLRNEKLNLTANLTKYFVPISFYNAKTTLLKEMGRIPFADLEYHLEKGIVKEDKDIVII